MITYALETDATGTPYIIVLEDDDEHYPLNLENVRWFAAGLSWFTTPINIEIARTCAIALDEMKERGLVPHE